MEGREVTSPRRAGRTGREDEMDEQERIKALKAQIDAMSQYELCLRWRFSLAGDPLLQGEVGEYFDKKLKEKGGFTPGISKHLGW
jgi:hypothetical protein